MAPPVDDGMLEADPMFNDFQEEDMLGDVFDEVWGEDFGDLDAVASPKADTGLLASEAPADLPLTPAQPRTKRREKAKAPEQQLPETVIGKWNLVMDTIKIKKPLAINEKDSVPYIQEFVESMITAAADDEAAWKQGQPMLQKMSLLPRAVAIMQKYAFAEIFITYDGCNAVAHWLKCLPNGELPNVHLRTSLLNCLLRLPITKEALSNCKDHSLGAIVAKLHQNPAETVTNRKAAGMLVQKWVKQVLAKKTDVFDLDALAEETENAPKGQLQRPAPETAESLSQLEAESELRQHPYRPQTGGREYVVQPLPKHQPLRKEKVALETNRGKLGEVLKVLSAPNKRCWKPYAVSVAGRTVNAV